MTTKSVQKSHFISKILIQNIINTNQPGRIYIRNMDNNQTSGL